MILEPSTRQKKLADKLDAYYFSLANVDTLSEKEQQKLYKEIASTIEKLYTFNVTEKVLNELGRVMERLMEVYVDKRFKSLEILETLT